MVAKLEVLNSDGLISFNSQTMSVYVIIIFLLCIGCGNFKSVQKPGDIKKVLTVYAYEASMGAFSKDTFFLLRRKHHYDSSVQFFYEKYFIPADLIWSNIENKKELVRQICIEVLLSETEANTAANRIKRLPVFYLNLLKPDIEYSGIDSALSNRKKTGELECDKILIQQSDGVAYRICRGMCQNIFINDSLKKTESVFKLYESPRSVKDFFVYDLLGDSSKEIIVFLTPLISREQEPIEINVFSLE